MKAKNGRKQHQAAKRRRRNRHAEREHGILVGGQTTISAGQVAPTNEVEVPKHAQPPAEDSNG